MNFLAQSKNCFMVIGSTSFHYLYVHRTTVTHVPIDFPHKQFTNVTNFSSSKRACFPDCCLSIRNNQFLPALTSTNSRRDVGASEQARVTKTKTDENCSRCRCDCTLAGGGGGIVVYNDTLLGGVDS